ncbi:MAG: NAD-dependent epimerase/dehydratase family protein [Lachnospiraceae bacterium]|nr:NAD-dependent epimerase/dehydratase family protein [Lachnospiraceae bacterium]
MKILVLGGTRFFGIPMVEELIQQGHEETIATRQTTKDNLGDAVKRIQIERTDPIQMEQALKGKHFDVVYDKIAYCSNDIKNIMDVIDCDKYIYMSSTAVYEPKKMDTKEENFDAMGKELIWCNRADFPYDEIKRQAECALWQKYDDRNWIAVRYPFVIGKDDYTKRMLFYVERKTGSKAVFLDTGDEAPYNGEPEYSINTDKAETLGFQFTNLKDWIYDLVDYYIERVKYSSASSGIY